MKRILIILSIISIICMPAIIGIVLVKLQTKTTYNAQPKISIYPVYVRSALSKPRYKKALHRAIITVDEMLYKATKKKGWFLPYSAYQGAGTVITVRQEHESEGKAFGACAPLYAQQGGGALATYLDEDEIRICTDRIDQLGTIGFTRDPRAADMRHYGVHTYIAHELLHALYWGHVPEPGCRLMCAYIRGPDLSKKEVQILKTQIMPKIKWLQK